MQCFLSLPWAGSERQHTPQSNALKVRRSRSLMRDRSSSLADWCPASCFVSTGRCACVARWSRKLPLQVELMGFCVRWSSYSSEWRESQLLRFALMPSGQFYGWQKQEDISREALRVFNMSLITGNQLTELGVGSSLFSFNYIIIIIKMYSNVTHHPLTAIGACDESVFPGNIYLDCLSHPAGSEQAVLKAAFVRGELHHHAPTPVCILMTVASSPCLSNTSVGLVRTTRVKDCALDNLTPGKGGSSRGFPSLWRRDCLGCNGGTCWHGKYV